MSTIHFRELERELLDDEQEREDARVERLNAAGKLCVECWATDIERETNLGVDCWHCVKCDARWKAGEA